VLFLVDHRLQFSGKKVGIIGLAIAKRVEAFDCPVNYYQRTKQAYPSYTYYPSVVELAASSDVLVVACPLNEHIVSREVVEALGPRGVLVNIGRGPHVDEPALAEGRDAHGRPRARQPGGACRRQAAPDPGRLVLLLALSIYTYIHTIGRLCRRRPEARQGVAQALRRHQRIRHRQASRVECPVAIQSGGGSSKPVSFTHSACSYAA
jgi:hypothetical protein